MHKQPRPPPLRSSLDPNPAGFRRLIEQGTDEIVRHWLEAVRADQAIPSTKGVEGLLLLDHVPLMLREILNAVGVGEVRIRHEGTRHAAHHGRTRARQHFSVKELVREHQLLREHLFLYLQAHPDQFAGRNAGEMLTVYRRVGLATDEAMREAVTAFVGERTRELHHLSRTDSLTGLFNHRIFYERLDEELKRAARYKSSLAIVLIDLDSFKAVNDARGHQFGDRLLVKCAELLRRELRGTDIICRYGGDEFSTLLPETTGAEAGALISRLQQEFIGLGTQEGAPASFGMSFGVAAYPEDGGTAARLVQIADERALRNKAVAQTGPHRATAGA